MAFWDRLLQAFGFSEDSPQLNFEVETELIQSLQDIAQREQRPEDEVAAELFTFALEQRDVAETRLQRWRSLSPREQQVTALVCLGYTNRQIARRLVISTETAKTHVRNAQRKFNLRSKADLRQALSDWDFSAWQDMDF